ncbi:C39 family peptidase [Mycobacterium conspicuum]|uniref:Peptidase C39-like domain-containing protein n=1 Tax=Mycobacterium conspicuum TaxID=44010 RepID=A0A7I7YCK4_9MYCO|nr:C39 family peptidase [Mycobacterium conspicuum]BBZ39450.1 hypothetical protein MCNS_25130 [Mycobacterium conspicuum]
MIFISRIATTARSAVVGALIGISSVCLVAACGSAGESATRSTPASPTAAGAPAAPTRPGGVYGDPEADARYWVQQSTEDTCGIASVAAVVGEVTGTAPTEQQVIKLAQDTPSSIRDGAIYLPTGDPGHETDKGGIDMADIVVLLAHYGIKSKMTYDAHPEEVGLPKLEEYLGANRKVIAWVNSGTILNSNDQRTSPDHFLVVTGVDTNSDTVHLNDPYADHGDTKVSVSKFMTAWKIGQESIVVTASPS